MGGSSHGMKDTSSSLGGGHETKGGWRARATCHATLKLNTNDVGGGCKRNREVYGQVSLNISIAMA